MLKQFMVLLLTITALSFANSYPAFESNADWETIFTARVKVSSLGQTLISGKFEPRGESPLKITFQKETSCPVTALTMRVSVRLENGHWEFTRHEDGLDHYSGGAIDQIRFEILSDTPMMCTLVVETSNGEIVPIATTQETLAGAVKYAGGFEKVLSFPSLPVKKISRFRLALPSYCKDVEILEASTVTEGVEDLARPLFPGLYVFEVNKGAGSRITEIRFAANGPAAHECQIPIYMTEVKED